jgi:hypothetical protein
MIRLCLVWLFGPITLADGSCENSVLWPMEAARTVTLDVTSCILEDSQALPQHIKLWLDSFLLFGSLAIS